MPISAVRSTDVCDELYRRAPRSLSACLGVMGGKFRGLGALLFGGSAYGGWTCGIAEPEVDAPSGWRVRRTSSEPHLRGAKLKVAARETAGLFDASLPPPAWMVTKLKGRERRAPI